MLKKRANGDMVVGAETEPPTSTLLINGVEVLLTRLEATPKLTPTLVAGRLRGAQKEGKDGDLTPSSTTIPLHHGGNQSQPNSILVSVPHFFQ